MLGRASVIMYVGRELPRHVITVIESSEFYRHLLGSTSWVLHLVFTHALPKWSAHQLPLCTRYADMAGVYLEGAL